MNSEVQKTGRPRFTLNEAFVVLVILFMVGLRLTAAALFVVLVLLYLLFPLHRSRRALWVTSALLALAVLTPFDVYVRSFHGPLYGSKQSGPRIVRLVWGMPMIQRCLDEYGEFISGGCVTHINHTRWVFVWD